MANTYKNIVITPNRSSNTADPKVVYSGGNTTANTDITLNVYPDSNGTLSWEGSAGQLFSITNDLSNNIFGVNDVSGIPSLEVYANGLVSIAPFGGNVVIGNTAEFILSPGTGLHANGSFGTAGQVLHSNGSAVYWAADDNAGGTVTSVASANGIGGGTITTSGTLYAVAGNSTVFVNSSGIHVNTAALPADGVTSVATGSGLTGGTITATGTVSVLANNGITANTTGLFVTQGTGTVVNSSGVHVTNVPNAITFNNGGAGAASGSTYTGSSTLTVSYNTVGAPSTTGTNASGTWSISINGSAASATNASAATNATNASNLGGVAAASYAQLSGATFTGTVSVPSGFTIRKQDNANEGGEFYIEKATNSTLAGNIIIDNNTNSIRIFEGSGSFRGAYLDISACGSQSALLHSSNYNSFAPTLTGTGASGTWSININGSAASATNASAATNATTATNWGTYGAVPAAGSSGGTPSTIPRSDVNGYTYFGYINSSTSNSENPGVSQVIVTNGSDNFYRKSSIASFTTYLTGTASLLTANNATNLGGVTSSSYLRRDSTAAITAGYTLTPGNLGTISTGTTTLNPATANYQYYTNAGAHTIAAPSSDCAIDVLVTNSATAGAITLSGFTAPTGGGGDTYATTNGNRYILIVRRINGVSTYSWKALQ
jgi:hypothetical protein